MIDAVVVVRNEARRLEACVRSLQNQDYPGGVNVIVVDHLSRDGSGDLAARLGARVVECRRKSLSAARNAGWRAAASDRIAFLDGHCVAEPSCLRLLAERMEQSGAAAVQGRLVRHYTHYAPAGEGARAQSAYPTFRTGNALFCRQALHSIGGFREELSSHEDVDAAWRILFSGRGLAFSDEAVCHHFDDGRRLGWIRRWFRYGVGAGQLAASYGLDLAQSGSGWAWRLYRWGQRWGWGRSPKHIWKPSGTVWWLEADDKVVVVRGPARYVLEGPGARVWLKDRRASRPSPT